jgi:protein associated with RNAse G/E
MSFTPWNEGDAVLLRGVHDGSAVYVQSTRLVKDTPQEVALAIWPGAECAAPAGYLHNKNEKGLPWERWPETLSHTLNLQKYRWHTNRFLILMEPEKYFATLYIWNAASEAFTGYYINFQLAFTRGPHGFDTLDLDLDIVIEPSYQWRWKDVEDYQEGIRLGGIRPEWVSRVEQARKEAAARLQERLYPLNGAWLDWRPDPAWSAPCLPPGWDSVE